MTYSKEVGGIFLAIGGLLLVQFGFSDSCSNEIVAKLSPLLGALPGLTLAYIGRLSKGDVKLSGFKKRR